jgi:hypothetical protein
MWSTGVMFKMDTHALGDFTDWLRLSYSVFLLSIAFYPSSKFIYTGLSGWRINEMGDFT